jgi:dinuclear metal center YbgI/SA1388 family protein
MVRLNDLLKYTDELLKVGDYQDYCPNGLQVEGRAEVRRIVSGVTASQALIDGAVEAQADLLLVHHGFFWKGEEPRLVGMKQRRIKTLLANDISLVAYHLPLDGHGKLGNNAQLADLLGVSVAGRFGSGPEGGIAMWGELPETQAAEALARHIGEALQREPLLICAGERPVKRLGWCSGAAQGYLEQAASLGLDAFISGEISEHTVHTARELGIHYLSAGHHATERYGVKALAEHLSEYFSLENHFLDIPNPV